MRTKPAAAAGLAILSAVTALTIPGCDLLSIFRPEILWQGTEQSTGAGGADGIVITQQPKGGVTYYLGQTEGVLPLEVKVSGGGTVSYQWYGGAPGEDGSLSWNPVEGAAASTYTPPTDTEGVFYYIVEIKNSAAAVTSGEAVVIVTPVVYEPAPPEPTGDTWVTVIFKLNGGQGPYGPADENGPAMITGDWTTEAVLDQLIEAFAPPTKSGSTFQGWYTEESGGDRIEFPYTVTGEATFWARWG